MLREGRHRLPGYGTTNYDLNMTSIVYNGRMFKLMRDSRVL